MFFILIPAGRTRSVPGEQTGKGGHPGDDGQVLEAKYECCAPSAAVNAAAAAAVQTGRVPGRIQAVRATGPRPFGGTVDGRTAPAVGSAHGRAPRGMRTTVGRAAPAAARAQGPFVVHVVLLRRVHDPRDGRGARQLRVLLLVRGRRHRGRRAARRGSNGSASARQQPRRRTPPHHPVPGHRPEVHVEALVKRCRARPFPSDSAPLLL